MVNNSVLEFVLTCSEATAVKAERGDDCRLRPDSAPSSGEPPGDTSTPKMRCSRTYTCQRLRHGIHLDAAAAAALVYRACHEHASCGAVPRP
jgi:hypothetical protein